MHTPWGEVRVADAHIHFFSRNFYDLLAAQKGAPESAATVCATLGWEVPPPDPVLLAGRWASEMDRCGVEHAALIASLPGDHASVARAVAAFPHRFFGYFLLDPLAADAPELLASALAQGLRGIVLFPAMHRFSAADPRLTFVYEAAAATPGSVVFVHCGILAVGVRKKLGIASQFDLRFSNPVDLHGVALAYPHVPFVVPHFGAGFFREALMLADLCPNVYFDTSSTNSWVRTQPEPLDLAAVFARALDVAGPRRLLFGTDSSFFPRGWHKAVFDQQVAALQTAGVSVEAAGLILGGNLRRLLNAA
jgi:hypothetical protein